MFPRVLTKKTWYNLYMSEIVPNSRQEAPVVAHWRPVAQFLGRLVGRGETLEEFEAARIAEVRAETAQVPGVVGRLGRLVDGLLLAPPESASITEEPYRLQIKRVVHPVEVTYPTIGNTVAIKRSTSYNYDPVFGRIPPGYDEITVAVTPNSSTDILAGTTLVSPGSDLREVGMRVRPNLTPDEWLVHGRYQAGDWDGHPGSQYKWEPLDEATASIFLDRVFGSERSIKSELS